MESDKEKRQQEIEEVKNLARIRQAELRQKEEEQAGRFRQYHEKFRTTLRRIFSISGDAAGHDEIRDRLLSGGQVTGTNLVILMCAIVIASTGLNTGSTAVIIGAMLISPLMGSILAMAYGTISADIYVVRHHATGFLFQILTSLVFATLYFLLSPIKEPTDEILARVNPTIYDILIAIAGGIAGIIGQTRSEKSNNIIPGVAIATALMPPLCVCGYSIANGQWRMLLGAGYLFLVNTYFIYLSAAIVLSILNIPKVRDVTDKQWKRLRRSMVRNTILIALPSILLAILAIHVYNL